MKKTLIPYLALGGRCEEALHHYTEALGGRVKTLMRLGETMPGSPPEHAQHILHSEFEAEGLFFMASDGMPGAPPPQPGDTISLALWLDSRGEQDRVWARLAEGGTVKHPLHDTFYGDRMGVLVDRFGIGWMISCPLAKP